MLGGHFAVAYGNADGWLVLVLLMLIGAWIRLFFNVRHAGTTHWWMPVAAAAALAAIAIWIRPPDAVGSGATGPPVTIAEVQAIVQRRCLACHVGATAPKGIRLETADEIAAESDMIEKVAVLTRVMPLGNTTHMTDAERQLLGRWIRQGAPTK